MQLVAVQESCVVLIFKTYKAFNFYNGTDSAYLAYVNISIATSSVVLQTENANN